MGRLLAIYIALAGETLRVSAAQALLRNPRLGNVLAAVGFLHGLSAEELGYAALDRHDPDYEAYDVCLVPEARLIGNFFDGDGNQRGAHAFQTRKKPLLPWRANSTLSPGSRTRIGPAATIRELGVISTSILEVLRAFLHRDIGVAAHVRTSQGFWIVLTFDDGYADNLMECEAAA